MPYRYFIQLSFDGAAYCGWQCQPNALTVQEVLEDSLRKICGHSKGVTGCGRTDSGVNARVFYAHLDMDSYVKEPQQLLHKLNRILPADIAVHSWRSVATGAHARFSAQWREYKYFIQPYKDPFGNRYAYQLQWNLDVDLMNQAAGILLKHDDFQCFSKVRTDVANFRCRIMEAEWTREEGKLVFRIKADRFLRNMVRSIVGTMIDVGRGRLSPEGFEQVLQSRDRRKAGTSVPANGLFLWDVNYPAEDFTDEAIEFSYESLNEIICHHQRNNDLHHSSGNEADE